MKKLFLTLLILTATLFSLTSLAKEISHTNQPQVAGVENENIERQATVRVVFNTLNTVEETLSFTNDTNAYELLTLLLNQNDIEYEVTQYDFGVFVTSIGDLDSNAQNSWLYSVNGETGQVAADAYTISDGDTIEWKFKPIEDYEE